MTISGRDHNASELGQACLLAIMTIGGRDQNASELGQACLLGWQSFSHLLMQCPHDRLLEFQICVSPCGTNV